MFVELNTTLSEEERAVRDQIHRFAEEVMRPASIALDKLADPEDVIKEGSIFWDVLRQHYELEHHLSSMPEELGGSAMRGVAASILAEEMGWGSADFSICFGVAGMPFSMALMASQLTGNQRLMDEFVIPYTKDRQGKYIGCWAITEPQHGSDCLAFNLGEVNDSRTAFDTYGRKDGDDWILTGAKSAWVSNGTIATHAMMHFAIDRSKGMPSSAIALVPLDLPGVSRGKPLNKLGQRALNQGEIFLDSVRIPKDYVFVDQDLYILAADTILAAANGGMGSLFTGVARAAFEEAMNYCKQRVQGGKCLCEHQLVQRKLFDMFIKVESSRQLARAVAGYNSQAMPPLSRLGIAAKVYGTQVAFEVASDAVQLFGGYGLSKEFYIEKLFRDARASMIEDGVNDVLALAGSRQLIDSWL
ncbi:MAG: acyl-CoA dehydrogenase family protein [Dehalococcoidia bacterium]|nr:acyl-CoA dehydrogenase family protein [Dehalococcoidia bacterium]